MDQRKKIAAIVTTYFPESHANLIVTKFLAGFPTEEGVIGSTGSRSIPASGRR